EAVKTRGLQEHYRIGIANGGEEQTVCPPRRRRIDDPYTRDVGEHGFGAFGVMLRRVDAGAARRAQHHGAGKPSLRAMPPSPPVIEQLVYGRVGKPGKLDL